MFLASILSCVSLGFDVLLSISCYGALLRPSFCPLAVNFY